MGQGHEPGDFLAWIPVGMGFVCSRSWSEVAAFSSFTSWQPLLSPARPQHCLFVSRAEGILRWLQWKAQLSLCRNLGTHSYPLSSCSRPPPKDLSFAFSIRSCPDSQSGFFFWLHWVFFAAHRVSLVVALRFPVAVVSLVVAHGLSYPAACGILVPGPGTEPMSPALAGRFSTTGSPGKSFSLAF